MYVQNLIIEVTRKCNLKCDHCLRGNSQNKTITEEIIKNIFMHVDSIGMLTITGGEPSLPSAIKAIEWIYHEMLWRNISITSMFVATNGTRKSIPFMQAIDHLIGLCDDQASCGIGISNDIYHEYERGYQSDVYGYQELLYSNDINNITEEMINNHTTRKSERWYNRGRAAINGIGEINEDYLDCIKLDDLENPQEIYGDMYVSCDGTIVGDTNMPYIDMKKYNRGNIMNWDDAMIKMKQSTIDNFEWCKKNCDNFEYCNDWELCKKAMDQIKDLSIESTEKVS